MSQREYALAMIQCKVLKQLENLDQQKYDEEDITHLLGTKSELRSGRLKWSPVHKSEKFWRDNSFRLNENNHELLNQLFIQDISAVLLYFHPDT
ncbi:unnamed protein product [Pleuronectes platessa]|uniref:ATPase V1 complex subunit H C-terminal domain-containing protein n=1 Tax=Pleuronectes platessa TaxID=8262 RepID=A0A9N7Y620_PLEPL|nr:unnamed protein product [Pleuronectes platessa]